MSWHTGPLTAFDTETTGVDVATARIVTTAIVTIIDRSVLTRPWLINPGVEIPAEASAIHGISTEHAVAYGTAPVMALEEIAQTLAESFLRGRPLVGFNICYDLTVLEGELARHELPALASRCDIAPVIDPLVIDRHVDKYRKGSRKLDAMCVHYKVGLDDAHEAGSDALAAARLAWRLGTVFPEIGDADPFELHALQIEWQAEWAAGFQKYLRRKDATAVIDGSWPLQQLPAVAA